MSPLACSLSYGLGAADLAAALELAGDRAQVLVDRARATGLVEPSHHPHFLRSVHCAVSQLVGTARHHELETALLRSQIKMSTLSPALALRLAEHGVRDESLADVLSRQAASGRGDAAAVARLYRAAVDAGAVELRPELADALARCGDGAAAVVETDELLRSSEPHVRAAAVRVAASVATHSGNSAQAAELFHWLGPDPDALVGAAAAIVLTAVGDAPGARSALATAAAGPPTAAACGARALAAGLLETLSESYSTAAAKLGQAMASG